MSFVVFGLIGLISHIIQLIITRGDCYTIPEVLLENLFELIMSFVLIGFMGALGTFMFILLLNL